MKNILKHTTLIYILGLIITLSSCKKDDADEIYVKKTGDLKVKIMNGEETLSNIKVKLAHGNGSLIDILTSDANGELSLTNFIEGSYNFNIEIKEPSYSNVTRQFQVVSGESRSVTFQTSESLGSLSLLLVNETTKELVKEDVDISIAIIPNNVDFAQATNNSQRLALATSIKAFGTEGSISFENIPSGPYGIFRVKNDTIEKIQSSYIYVRPQLESVHQIHVNLKKERLFKKEWNLSGVTTVLSEGAESTPVNDFPVNSIKFFTNDNGDFIQFKMEDGKTFTSGFYLNKDGILEIGNLNPNQEGYQVMVSSENELTFDEGKVILKVGAMRFYYPDNTVSYYNLRLTLS